MTKLTDFVGLMTSGFARSNRYTVMLSLPQMLQHHPSEVEKMLILCDQVQLPGLNVNTAQIRAFGEIREMPYEFNYEPIQLSFYVDGDMVVKGIFDDWIKSIQQGRTRNFNYYDNYICPKMQIAVQNVADESVYGVNIYEAYPKTITAVQMGYDQKDIMKVTVTMMYRYWETTTLANAEVPSANVPTSDLFLGELSGIATGNTYTNFDNSYVDPMGNIAFKF